MIYCDEIQELLPHNHGLGYDQQPIDYGELFLRALVTAIPKVPESYFRCSNANQAVAEQIVEQCFQNTKKSPIKKAAFTYGERAFCYELYHQLRVVLENIFYSGKPILHGELKKETLKDVTKRHLQVKQLNKEYVPDFLLHSPGDFENQEVVMEVKTSPKLQVNHIIADILKLDEFISTYHFNMGIFLAVNVSMDNLKAKLRKHADRLQHIATASNIHIISAENSENVLQTTLAEILEYNQT
ncbi:MAG: hypothetical protein WCL71_02485 [Deltaproteobacteria bacterium]